MTTFDLLRIRRETNLRHLEYHDSLESTNQLANQLLADLQPLCPALVLAAEQTAGRGRGTNSWWASTGALTFSLVIDPTELSLPTARLPLMSLAVGVAVRRVLANLARTASVTIKWPNDILLNERKVCGILTEQHTVHGRPVIIVGVGINVNNALHGAPPEVRQRATSLFDSTGDSVDLSSTLIAALNAIDDGWQQLSHPGGDVLEQLNRHSVLTHRSVTIEISGTLRRGVCHGINQHGALLLQTSAGLETVVAGTVVEW